MDNDRESENNEKKSNQQRMQHLKRSKCQNKVQIAESQAVLDLSEEIK